MIDRPPETLGDGDSARLPLDPTLAVVESATLIADQRQRWARGDRVPAEHYWPLFQEGARNAEGFLDLIYQEILLREGRGESPSGDEYAQRFPQFERAIRDQFEVHAALGRLEEPSAERVASSVSHTVYRGRERSEPGPLPAVPGYEMVRELGRGGMGVVYLAWQSGLGRMVALKMILAGKPSRARDEARFRIEAEAVARLEHPNIVRIYEVGEYEGRPFFSLEYVEGGRLADSLRGNPQPPQKSAGLVETLARATHTAHDRGVVHRDLTPGNVLLTADGEPKIVDFGLAKLVGAGDDQTATGDILGTPSYMAPEQAGGRSKKVGPTADVYALGAILYEMLTGRAPFKAETPLDTLMQAVNEEPVAPRRLQPRVPRDLETVCLKCLEKSPARRYARAADLADDLRRYLDGQPVQARPVGPAGRLAKWARRRPGTAALVASCAVGAIAAFVVVMWQAREARQSQVRAERAGESERSHRVAAETARQREAEQRLLYQGLTARLLRDRALRECESGDIGGGLLSLGQSLRLAPDGDPGLRRAIRTNIEGWMGEAHALGAVLEHREAILTAGFSPDGQVVVTGGADGSARVWDCKSGRPHGSPLYLPRAVTATAISPDGGVLATFAGRQVKCWKTATGAPTAAKVMDAGGTVLAIRFIGAGETLRTVAARAGKAWLTSWDTVSGDAKGPAIDVGRAVDAVVTFSGDGEFVVVASEGQPTRLWTAAGRLVHDLNDATKHVSAVAFNPKDGRAFATGSYDNTCRLWLTDGTESGLSPIRHPGPVRALAYSPDGRTLLIGGADRTARFWDAETGKPRGAPLRHPGYVNQVAFSPNGRHALSVSWDQVRVWEVETGEPVGAPLPHTREVLSAAFCPDGDSILTRSRDGVARLWRTATIRPALPRLTHANWVTSVAFRPPAGESFLTGCSDRKVRTWSSATGEGRVVPVGALEPVLSLAYRPDGRVFAAGTRGRKVWLWDEQAQGPARAEPLALADRVWALAFSPDGKTLVSGIEQRRAEFWDVASGKKLSPTLGHDKGVYSVAFRPDGRVVLTGSEDKTARLWDAETGAPLLSPLEHQGTVYSVAFRPPEGRMVLTGCEDGTARLWNAETGRPVGAPFPHPGRVMAVAFSADGRVFVTGCQDGYARLWETETGHPLWGPLAHRGPVRTAAFRPSPEAATSNTRSLFLVTGSEDRSARIWEFGELAGKSVEDVVRSLEAATGMTLDAHGVPQSLEGISWRQRLRADDPRVGAR